MFNPPAIDALLSGQRRDPRARVLRALLRGLEPFYALAIALRHRLYDLGLCTSRSLARPVISIGNITTGGTGKTPMTLWLATELARFGQQPAILTRGHGRGAGESDEVMEMRQALGTAVPIGVDANRHRGGRKLLAEKPQTSVLILDDGFQHRRLHRDLDIVLIDATCPLGHGHLLPRGLLRDLPWRLRHAQAVVVTRCDQVDTARLAEVDQAIAVHHGRPPLGHVSHRWTAWRCGEQQLEMTSLANEPVAVMLGLGNPKAFLDTLARHGLRVVVEDCRPDHARYDAATLAAFDRQARAAGAVAIVTSEKDYVKWADHPALPGALPGALPVYRPLLSLYWHDGRDELITMIKQSLARRR